MKTQLSLTHSITATVLTIFCLLFLLPGIALAQTVVFEENFDGGAPGWYADNGVWEIGEATVGPVGSGNVAGTILGGNYPYQAYSRLISPSIPLPGSPQDGALWLRFSDWHYLHYGNGTDYGQVLIRIGPNEPWQILNQIRWLSPYWTEFMADLAPYAGETVQIAFLIDDNYSGYNGHLETNGWYIDNLLILEGDFPDRGLHTFDDDVEDTWEGWSADNGCWQIGEPTSGPSSTRSGRNCAGTNLEGSYYYLANSRLISPPFDLSPSPIDGEIWLSFWSWSWLHYGNGIDYGQVLVQAEGGEWEQLLVDFKYLHGCWSPSAADLSDYAGQTVRIAFRIVDTYSGYNGPLETTGLYIDDVAIREGKRWLNNVEDFEGAITGWASTAGLWQMGAPTSGPGAAHSGDRCWGTNLAGNYSDYARSALQSTRIDLPVSPPVQLSVWQWFSFSTSNGTDYGYISVKHAEGDTIVSGNFTGSSGGWSRYIIDLSAFAGQTVQIGFRMVDVYSGYNGNGKSSGWYLDDFEFLGLETSTPSTPVLVDVNWSTGPPVINYFAYSEFFEKVCIYACKDDDVIPDLSNRVAVLPADGAGSFVDTEHPGWGRYYYQITGVDALGHEGRIAGPYISGIDDSYEIPSQPRVVLHGPQPNPFNPKAEVSFTITKTAHVLLEVFDIRGRLMNRLLDESMPPGKHSIPFENRRLASGTYLVRLQVGDQIKTCKMMLTK